MLQSLTGLPRASFEDSRRPMGDSITQQDYASSPLDNAALSGKGSGYNSLEIASTASASAVVSVLIALVILFLFARKLHPSSKITATTNKQEVTMCGGEFC
ncbi:hypothetical protein Bca52824_016737 [Brassica carinata]|uniref:Uncharacterized protein n=1 Tax=Brassica carinata TaxID=52824 RepID=A0A8X7W5N7_BRACI|nr:hypothetical protein Bca52824_016737 [Brassica carinata]